MFNGDINYYLKGTTADTTKNTTTSEGSPCF